MLGAGTSHVKLSKEEPTEHYPPRTSYHIDRLNKPTMTALSILSLTNSENFARRREQIVYTMLGIGSGATIRDRARKKIISDLALQYLTNGLLPSNSLENANKLADGLLEETISPYEATGIIKELCPEITSGEMTKLWTTFSIITGLRHLKDRSLSTNWEKSIEENSIHPKILNLTQSLESKSSQQVTKEEDKTIIKRKYYENYAHLKTSCGANTNWAEVLSNLPASQAGLLKSMLNSSKDNILKEQATKDSLWPAPIHKEIENKRLNNLLKTLGNRPTGRSQRYSRILLNENEKSLPEGIPAPQKICLTEKEVILEKKLTNTINEFLKQRAVSTNSTDPNLAGSINAPGLTTPLPTNPSPKKSQRTTGKIPWYSILLKFGKINKIDSQNAKNANSQILEILRDYIYSKLPEHLADKPRKTELFFYKVMGMSISLRDKILETLLNNVHPIEETQRKLKGYGVNLLKNRKYLEGEVPDSLVISGIEHSVVENPKENIDNLAAILPDPNCYRNLFKEFPYNQSKTLKQYSQRTLQTEEEPLTTKESPISYPKPSRFKDVYSANVNGLSPDLTKTYGPGRLTPLHIASWYGGPTGKKTGAELSAIIEEHLKKGINLNPKDVNGNTPLHKSSPYATAELLKSGAKPNIKNNDGILPSVLNQYSKSTKEMLLEAAKKETIGKIASSPVLEI